MAHVCQECGNEFGKADHLKSHMVTPSKERPFACKVCPSTFKLKNGLRVHMLLHNPASERFQCPHCPKTFLRKQEQKGHILTHTKSDRVACTQCGLIIRGKYLATHMRIHTNVRPYECTICSKFFRVKRNLHRHMRTHTGEKPFVCSECPKAYAQLAHLTAHRRVHTNQLFHCEFCSRTFTNRTNLRKHVVTHTRKSDFMCNLCPYAAPSYWALELHMVVHTRERAFRCNKCDKYFPTGATLALHKKSHLEEKLNCLFCTYKTHIKQAMDNHIRGHLDEKTNECPFCDYSAVRLRSIQTHILSHTREKSHKCSHCDQGFSTTSALAAHWKTHKQTRKRYTCDICRTEFTSNRYLTIHKGIHSGCNPCKCPFCDKGFLSKSRLNAHIRRMHTSNTVNKMYRCNKCVTEYTSFTSIALLMKHQKSRRCLEARLPTQQVRICLKRIDE